MRRTTQRIDSEPGVNDESFIRVFFVGAADRTGVSDHPALSPADNFFVTHGNFSVSEPLLKFGF